MEDLIRRSDAIKGAKRLHNLFSSPFYNRDRVEMIEAYFNDIPSADRPQGEWKISNLPKGKVKYCSECGFGQHIKDERMYNFCPNCGADMRGADDE